MHLWEAKVSYKLQNQRKKGKSQFFSWKIESCFLSINAIINYIEYYFVRNMPSLMKLNECLLGNSVKTLDPKTLLWLISNMDNYAFLRKRDPTYLNKLVLTILSEKPNCGDYTWYLDAGYGDIDFDDSFSVFFLVGYKHEKNKNTKYYSGTKSIIVERNDSMNRPRIDSMDFMECCGKPDICVEVLHEEGTNGPTIKIFEDIMESEYWIEMKQHRAENNVYILLNAFNDAIELLNLMSRTRVSVRKSKNNARNE